MDKIFRSYTDVARFMSRARNKSAGRPICSGHWRMFQDGDKYIVKSVSGYFDRMYAQFNPDNTVEFHNKNTQWGSNQISYHYMIMNTTGFWVDRVAKGRYHIHPPTVGIQYRQVENNWRRILTGIPEDAVPVTLFDGVKMNLTTYECLNPREYVAPVAIPEVRKQWLRDSKWFKQQFKILAKLGALDLKMWVNPNPYRAYGNDYSGLLCMMQERQIDLAEISVFAQSFFWGQPPSSTAVCELFDTFMRSQSLKLRWAYGVFGEPK